MKKRDLRGYIVEFLVAAMLITGVLGLARLSLTEAMASEGGTGAESSISDGSATTSTTSESVPESSATTSSSTTSSSSAEAGEPASHSGSSEPQNNGTTPAQTGAAVDPNLETTYSTSCNIAFKGPNVVCYSNGIPRSDVSITGFNIKITSSKDPNTPIYEDPEGQYKTSWDQDIIPYVDYKNGYEFTLTINSVQTSPSVSINSISPISAKGQFIVTNNDDSDPQAKITFDVPGITVKTKDAAKMPSDYEKLEEAEFGDDSKHSSVGLTFDGDEEKDSKTIAKSRVGKILDYVYENGPDNVKSAITEVLNSSDNKALSFAVVVTTIKDPSDKEKDALKDRAKDFDDAKDEDVKMGRYFDISVYLKVGSKVDEKLKISDLGKSNPLHFKLDASKGISSSSSSSSSSAKSSGRYYNAVTYHDGGGHSVGIDEYQTDKNLEFEVYKFSTFATAYYDKKSSSSSAASKSSSFNPNASTSGNKTPDTGGKAPKTGDNFNPRIWIYLVIVCATVAAAAWILLQDTKDENEKESGK